MRLCRFNDDKLGLVNGDVVYDVTVALDIVPTVRWPLPAGDPVIAHLDQLRNRIKQIAAEVPKHPLADVRLLSPVANPGKIMAAPANHRLHVELDTKDPAVDAGIHRAQLIDMEAPTEKLGLFLKANSSLVGPSEESWSRPHSGLTTKSNSPWSSESRQETSTGATHSTMLRATASASI